MATLKRLLRALLRMLAESGEGYYYYTGSPSDPDWTERQ